jgi:hypothetical protein
MAKMKHDDEAQDKKLISKMIKASEKKEPEGMKHGGKVKKMDKGGVTSAQAKSMGRNMARAMNQKSGSRGR